MASISISWSETNIDKVANTSVVNVTARMSPSSSDTACAGWIKVGGTFAKNDYGENIQGINVGRGSAFSGKLTVKHNPDGSCNNLVIAASVSANDYGMVSKSITVNLTKIDRSTTITRANEATFGETCSIEFNPLETSVYYKCTFSIGSWEGTSNIFCPRTTSAYTYKGYTIPLEAAMQVTDRMKSTMSVTLYSYADAKGRVAVGNPSTSQFVIGVPNSMVPTISYVSATAVNSNNIISEWGINLAGFTKVRVLANGAGAYGSKIVKFTITGGYSRNIATENLDYTGSVIQISGDVSFTVTCTDSRGMVSVSKTSGKITFLAYYPPTITAYTADKDSDGNAVLSFAWNNGGPANPIGDKNTCSGAVKYRISGKDKGTWYSLGDVSSGTDLITNIKPDDLTSYVFRLTVSDLVGGIAERDAYLSTAKVLLDFKAGGNGLGIGKICENDRMEVAMETDFEGDVKIKEVLLDEYIRRIMPVLHESMFGIGDPPIDGRQGQIYFKKVT